MTRLKAFRLPSDIVKKLVKLTKATHRSEAFYVTCALKHYLDDYADAQIAKDRFSDPDSKIISGKELKERLGI